MLMLAGYLITVVGPRPLDIFNCLCFYTILCTCHIIAQLDVVAGKEIIAREEDITVELPGVVDAAVTDVAVARRDGDILVASAREDPHA